MLIRKNKINQLWFNPPFESKAHQGTGTIVDADGLLINKSHQGTGTIVDLEDDSLDMINAHQGPGTIIGPDDSLDTIFLKYITYDEIQNKAEDDLKKIYTWIQQNKLLQKEDNINATLIYQSSKLRQSINENKIGKYNCYNLFDNDYYKTNEPYCVIKIKKDNLLFIDDKIQHPFNEYLEITQKILFLIYNIHKDKDKDKDKLTLYYLFEKDKDSARSLDHVIRVSKWSKKGKSWSVAKLFKWVRNYQLILIKQIYEKIIEIYKLYKIIKEEIKEIKEIFLNIITKEEENFKKTIGEESYNNITQNESKLRYIYSMFMDYLKNIYIPHIIKAFILKEEYSKFNMFNIYYLKNILLLKNNIFYSKILDKNMFNFGKLNADKKKDYEDEIDRINFIIQNINLFIINLQINEHDADTKLLGKKLLGIKISEDEYEKKIKQFIFFSNVFIDFAVFWICPADYTYDSEIINSPASVLDETINLCKIIDDIPRDDYTKKVKILNSPASVLNKINNFCEIIDDIPYVDYEKKVKIYGTYKDIYKYKMTCTAKYESSDYLYINSPISKFVLFYWSPLVNSYLTEQSIFKKDNNVLIWDRKLIAYNLQTRFKKQYSPTQLLYLMTNYVYLGYIKLSLIDGIKLIFIFIRSYYIELYDITGTNIIYGNYSPFSFITQQEIALLKANDLRANKVFESNNKNYYLMLKEHIAGLVDDTNKF